MPSPHPSPLRAPARPSTLPWGVAAWILGALVVAGAGCAPARYRDPGRALPVRTPEPLTATVGVADTVDGHLVEPVRLRAASGLTVDLLLKRPLATAATGVAAEVAAGMPAGMPADGGAGGA